MTSDDRMYVGHILDAIGKVDSYLAGQDAEVFVCSDLLIDGVARELSIIGEAASHLSAEFREDHPEVPFRDIISMRNIIVHEYAGVEAIFLWNTYRDDLPVLEKILLPFRPE